MSDRTPGQIAFDAHQKWYAFDRTWAQVTPKEQAEWEFIGQAVAEAIAPMPEVSSDR